MNFKSKKDYRRWLDYIHSTGLAESTPGNQSVSIKGKKKKVEHAEGGIVPTNDNETMYYPFGGLINQGVTGIAKAFGANDKTAQIIGSGVATATGLIPGMQDNFLQAGDLTGDIMKSSGNKQVANAGQTVGALSPLLNMLPTNNMANGGDIPKLDIMPNEDTNTLQTPAPYVWDLKNYKEQQSKVISGVDPMTGLPTYETQNRTPRIKAHAKNVLNALKGNERAQVATQFANGGMLVEGNPTDKSKIDVNNTTPVVPSIDPNADLVKRAAWFKEVKAVNDNPNLSAAQKSVEAKRIGDKLGFNYSPAMNINTNQASNQYLKTQYAEGGQLTEFQGGTHEEGGVPLGNSNNEVEGGETKVKDYIFSDRIKTPWNKKTTFAQESKKINSRYKDRKEDALAQKSLEIELTKLRDSQEVTKQNMIAKASKLMSNAGIHQMPDGSMMPNNQMAYGGKLYYVEGGELINSGSPYDYVPTTTNSLGINTLPEDLGNEYPNYTPEEQLVMQGLQTDLAKSQADINYPNYLSQEDYQSKIGELGQGYMGQDYYQKQYPQYFNQSGTNQNTPGTTSTTPTTPNDLGKTMGQAGVNTPGGENQFNDQLTGAEKAIPFLPVLGQAATLIGGAEKTQYSQVTPEFVDLKAQRTAAEKQAAIARLTAGQNIRNTAGNSGRGLANTVVANAGIQDNLSNQLSQSYMNEANLNAQIGNQANQFNTQIQNQQVNANEANRARFQEQAIMTLSNLSNTYTGVNKDQRAYAANNQYNNIAAANLGTENYVVGYTADGTPIMKFKPSNI